MASVVLLLVVRLEVLMVDPTSPQARAIATLINWTSVLGGLIFVLVTGLVLYVAWRFRDRGGSGEPRQYPGNRNLEVAWTIAPAVIVSGLFIASVGGMRAIDPPGQEPDIVVTGNMWWWRVEYPKAGFVTANELHIPVGKPVLLQLKSDDVIHSFWVPELGPKRDMIPGHSDVTLSLTADNPGVYPGNCSEFCGQQHAWMWIHTVAQPQAEYDAWLLQQQAVAVMPSGGDAARGARVFQEETCVNCHAIRGTPATAPAGPDLTHLASRAWLGAGVIENTPENLALWIANPHAFKPGVQMPGYELGEEDLRALVAYLWSLK